MELTRRSLWKVFRAGVALTAAAPEIAARSTPALALLRAKPFVGEPIVGRRSGSICFGLAHLGETPPLLIPESTIYWVDITASCQVEQLRIWRRHRLSYIEDVGLRPGGFPPGSVLSFWLWLNAGDSVKVEAL